MSVKKEIITSRKQLKDWIKYETGGDRKVNLLKEIFGLGERAIINKFLKRLRKTEYYYNSHKKIRYFFSKMRLSRLQNKYGFHIGINVCGRGLNFMHVGSVLINGRSCVGKDCKFHINTALVANGPNDEAPVLGDGIIVGIGAVIVGGVKIANNVAVGANAVVCKDVLEENVAVAGVPAKVVSKNGALTWNKKSKNQ